jgi:hypothetical protein
LAFGSSMTAIPTSPSTGTGIYIDYRGIYGILSGTPQFTIDATTGAITAISGTIGGWTITSTALSNAGGTVTMRGAGNLAFGATPPTSATVGTGIFINNAGVYGLASNVQQFYLQASDGKAYAGAGAVTLDTNGVSIVVTDGFESARSYKFKNAASTEIGSMYAFYTLADDKTDLDVRAYGTKSSEIEIVAEASAAANSSASAVIGTLKSGAGAVQVGMVDDDTDVQYIHFDLGGNEKARIDANGDLGLGTTSPSFPLDIRAASGFPMLGVGKLGANEYMNFVWDVTSQLGMIQTTSRSYEVRVDASLFKVHTNNTLRLTIANGGVATFTSEVEIDGALNHDGSTVGFYGVTPASRPSAYTQTYSTATRTHAAMTSADLTNLTGGTATDVISDVGGSFDQTTLNDNFSSIADMFDLLRADLINVKGVLNAQIDDRQADGLAQ